VTHDAAHPTGRLPASPFASLAEDKADRRLIRYIDPALLVRVLNEPEQNLDRTIDVLHGQFREPFNSVATIASG
jgi:hypothetical protein